MSSTRLLTRSLPSLLSPRIAHRTLALQLQLGTTPKARFHQSSARRNVTPPFKPEASIISAPTPRVAPTSFRETSFRELPLRTPLQSYSKFAELICLYVPVSLSLSMLFTYAVEHQVLGDSAYALSALKVLKVLSYVALYYYVVVGPSRIRGSFAFTREKYERQVKLVKELGLKGEVGK